MITEREWNEFFRVLNKIVDEEKSVDDKIEQVLTAAKNNGEKTDMNLEEFLSWDFGY